MGNCISCSKRNDAPPLFDFILRYNEVTGLEKNYRSKQAPVNALLTPADFNGGTFIVSITSADEIPHVVRLPLQNGASYFARIRKIRPTDSSHTMYRLDLEKASNPYGHMSGSNYLIEQAAENLAPLFRY